MMKVIEGGKKEISRVSASRKRAEEERIAAERASDDARREAVETRKALEEVQRALEESQVALEESQRSLDVSHRALDEEEKASEGVERAMADAYNRMHLAEITLAEVLARKGDAEATLAEVLGRVGEAERLATLRGDEAEAVGRRVEAARSMVQAIITEVSSLGADLEEVCGSLYSIRSVCPTLARGCSRFHSKGRHPFIPSACSRWLPTPHALHDRLRTDLQIGWSVYGCVTSDSPPVCRGEWDAAKEDLSSLDAQVQAAAADLKRCEQEVATAAAARDALDEELSTLCDERLRLISAIDGLRDEESGLIERRDEALAAAIDAEQQVINTRILSFFLSACPCNFTHANYKKITQI